VCPAPWLHARDRNIPIGMQFSRLTAQEHHIVLAIDAPRGLDKPLPLDFGDCGFGIGERIELEAVAQGLAAIRANEWVAGIAQGLNVVKVAAADVRVEHEVKLMDFTKWLEKNGGSPREVSDRQKIRSILGMPVSR
jgi:hypothetical protein